jgi:hypothetical protein
MPQCKLCLKDKALIKKSHIIPDFMYRHSNMYNEKHQLYVFSLDELIKGKKARMVSTGEYEGGILCAECDNQIIGGYEEYGRIVLFGDPSGKNNPVCDLFVNQDQEKFTLCENVDYRRYKLFMLSMLWRMSISSREAFQDVKLSPEHEENLRRMILDGNPREFYVYPVLSSYFLKDPTAPSDMIVSPIHYHDKGLEKVNLILPGMFHVYVLSTDPKAFPEKELRNMVINEDNRLFIYELEKGMTMNYIKRQSGI